MRQITTSSLSNQSLTTALLCHTYTADADRMLFVRLFADQVAGNGTYYAYVTIQRLGTGSAYEVQPRTAPSVASGVTAIAFSTTPIPVKNTDVVKVYLLGLAGDTTTPDTVTEIWEDDSLCPTTSGRTLDVSSGGEAGIDWANVGSPTTTVGLSGTTVATATNLTNAPTAGDLTATMKTSVTTAATAATPTAAAVTGAVGSVTGNVGGNVVGSVASVVGAVGSVAGNVGGNVAGSVASVTGGVTVTTNNDKTGYALSSAGIQAIWDALTSALTTVGSVGKLIVDNLNATISSRLASASYTAPDNATVTAINTKLGTPAGASVSADIATVAAYIDTEVAAIKAKTDNLPASPAATSDIPSASTNASTLLATVLESGKTVAQAILDLWAKEVGRATANSAESPTSITYRSPDDTVQITHTHSDTTRSVS